MTFDATIDDLLARGIAVRFRAAGDSMYPAIRCGEYLLVEPVELGKLSRGDVVLARLARGLTAHRIVHLAGSRIITRGDHCSTDDPVFTAEQIVGMVAASERNGRRRPVQSRNFARARGWVRRALTFFSRRRLWLFAVSSVV